MLSSLASKLTENISAFRKIQRLETPSIRYLSSRPRPSYSSPKMMETDDGRQFAAFQKNPKLKPSVVARRLKKMRTYEGSEKNIRHSPWRLNLVCQFAAGLPLQEALTQLEFCKKEKAPLVQKILTRTANLADIRHGLQPSQLEVAECFATKGRHLKRINIMGRGRHGMMEHKHSHMRVVLREMDFKLRIYQAPSINQKKKLFLMQQQAERDGAKAKAEREELVKLEKEAKANAAKKA
jgi:large subunit ribosomal protein L22